MSISPNHDEDHDDRIPTPPPPPRISKISIGFNKPAPKVRCSFTLLLLYLPIVGLTSICPLLAAADQDDFGDSAQS